MSASVLNDLTSVDMPWNQPTNCKNETNKPKNISVVNEWEVFFNYQFELFPLDFKNI